MQAKNLSMHWFDFMIKYKVFRNYVSLSFLRLAQVSKSHFEIKLDY